MEARELGTYGALCFVSIFGVVNPIRAAFVFDALGGSWDARARAVVARRAVLVAAAILFAATWIGNHFLVGVGIHLGGFRVAGSLVVLTMTLRQLALDRPLAVPAALDSQTPPERMALSPVAIPLLAGVGPVATVILYSGETSELWRRVVTMATLALTLLLAYAMLRFAGRLREVLGELGARFLSHLLALTAAAWSIDFLTIGVRDLLPLILTTTPAR